MSTAQAADDDIVTMEMVDSKKERSIDPSIARVAFLTLGVVAAIALIAAIVIVLTTPKATVTLLTIALVTLAVVVVAEIVLLILARPKRAQ